MAGINEYSKPGRISGIRISDVISNYEPPVVRYKAQPDIGEIGIYTVIGKSGPARDRTVHRKGFALWAVLSKKNNR
jgi:hypothetical protein